MPRKNFSLSHEKEFYELAEFFKALGDLSRIKILYLLSEQDMCVGDIAQRLNSTESAVSHQLRYLRVNRFVRSVRQGKYIFYTLADDYILSMLAVGESILKKNGKKANNPEQA